MERKQSNGEVKRSLRTNNRPMLRGQPRQWPQTNKVSGRISISLRGRITKDPNSVKE
jgi:hypothetical protein